MRYATDAKIALNSSKINRLKSELNQKSRKCSSLFKIMYTAATCITRRASALVPYILIESRCLFVCLCATIVLLLLNRKCYGLAVFCKWISHVVSSAVLKNKIQVTSRRVSIWTSTWCNWGDVRVKTVNFGTKINLTV